MRCSGWTTADGWCHCSREEHAGNLLQEAGGTYPHRLHGDCRCGGRHESFFGAAEPARQPGDQRPAARTTRYEIRNADREVVAVHVRRDLPDGHKAFAWERPNGRSGLDGVRVADLPLYLLPELLAAPGDDLVILVEGEKAADALRLAGSVAVGTVTGAGGTPSDASLAPLVGRDIHLWPDHDDAGRRHMSRIASALKRLGCTPCFIDWPAARAPGDDAADFLERGGTPDDLRALLGTAVKSGAAPCTQDDAAQTAACPSVRQPRPTPYEPPPVGDLPMPARDLVRTAAASIDCDSAFVLLPVLAVMSAAVGASRALQLRPGQVESGLLWLSVVCESGSGKTPALQFATAPIRRREKQARQEWKEAQAEYERDLAAWEKSRRGRGEIREKPQRPPTPRWYTSDVTVEKVAAMLEESPRGFLLARDELRGWFAFDRYSKAQGAEQAAWLSIHSGQTLAVDRKGGDRFLVDRPFVAITGGVQAAVLRRIVSDEPTLVEAGLLGRVLLAHPPTWPREWSDEGVPESVENAWSTFIEDLCKLEMESDGEGGYCPRVVEMTEEARVVWRAWFARAQEGRETAASAAERLHCRWTTWASCRWTTDGR